MFELALPPVSSQEKISKALSSINDMIELNKKLNKNYYELEKAVFYHKSKEYAGIKKGGKKK